jgi:hypothetical protein
LPWRPETLLRRRPHVLSRSLGALHALVLEQFETTPERAREDLDRFVHELEQRGLVEIVER